MLIENQKGWICPKCNASLSPVQKYCPICTKPSSVKEDSKTEEKQILLEIK